MRKSFAHELFRQKVIVFLKDRDLVRIEQLHGIDRLRDLIFQYVKEF